MARRATVIGSGCVGVVVAAGFAVRERQRLGLWRLRPQVLRGAWWAWRSVRQVRRDLPVSGVRTQVAPPRRLTPAASPGVAGVLRRLSPTCLERALVAQRWLVVLGQPCDVVIGARFGEEPGHQREFAAHAWIDGTETVGTELYAELCRIAAPEA